MIRTLNEYFDQTVERFPNKIALYFQAQQLTFEELKHQTLNLANALRKRGIRRQDRILVCLGNTPEAIISFWGSLRLGACVSILTPDQGVDKIRFIINDAGPKALVCTPELAAILVEDEGFATGSIALIVVEKEKDSFRAPQYQWFSELVAEESSESYFPLAGPLSVDLASIIFTSGSTGEPKGVVMGHDNMVVACDSITRYLGLSNSDVILVVLPLSFDYGLYQIIMAMAVGATVVLEKKLLNPAIAFKRIDEKQCTVVPLVPSLATLLGDFRPRVNASLASVKIVTNTGAALTRKHVETVKEVFPTAQIFSMYGLTECKRCTYLPPADIDRKPNSVGIAIPNTEIIVVDEDNQPCGAGKVGQLVVRGGTVMRGYWRREELTAKRIKTHPVYGDRALFTGDFGYLDEEGYFFFVGRADETMKIRGRKVAPLDVEGAIRGFYGVTDVAIAPVIQPATEDDAFVAFVCGRFGDEFESSMEELSHRLLAPYHRPIRFFHISGLPTTPNGKVDRNHLRKIAEERLGIATPAAVQPQASGAIRASVTA